MIIERLGRGGMGQVFLGSDPRLHRKVALKCLIAADVGGDEIRTRILHEARAAACISHPNIAAVHDVIEHEARAFIVMEYVEGESLATTLKRHWMPIDRVIAIGRQLASALAAAHAKGIIHRDLKPANIQMTPDGSAKVLDFGVAKAVAEALSTAAGESSTTHSAVPRGQPGTPGYMSPEQLLGRDVEERSDIFNLGLILFEMATGRRPFPTADPLDLVVALSKRPPRADEVDARVPTGLADVIATALELDLELRFQSAAEFGSALEAIELGLEPPPATTRRAGLPVAVQTRLTPLRILVAVLAVPAVLGLLGFLNTIAFDLTLGRTAPFDHEPPLAYVTWGLRSLVAPLVYLTATMILFVAIRLVARVLSRVAPIAGVVAKGRDGFRRLRSSLELDDPVVLAQAIATLGLVAVIAVAWRYRNLIVACASFINTSAPGYLEPLRPDYSRGYAYGSPDASRYRIALDLIILGLSVGAIRVIQLRARRRIRKAAGAFSALIAVLALAVLMVEMPYRILWQNDFERIDLAGTRCYILGEHLDEWLIHCPDVAPPRNRVIKSADPTARRARVTESIFTPANRSRSGS